MKLLIEYNAHEMQCKEGKFNILFRDRPGYYNNNLCFLNRYVAMLCFFYLDNNLLSILYSTTYLRRVECI